VPVPSPVSFAVLMMPVPLANSWRALSSLSASAPGRPSLLRTLPALLTNLPSRTDYASRHVYFGLSYGRGSQGFLYGVTKICRGCQLARHSSSYRTLGIAPLAKSGVRLLTESDPHGPATAGRSSVPEKRGVPIEEITVLARERFQSW
jgi:hypothetical protein